MKNYLEEGTIESMNILVTGACGFIGSNLCQSLLEDGHFVTGVDAFTENYPAELKKTNLEFLLKFDKFSFIQEDLLKMRLVRLLEDKDIVYHLAGQPSVHNSWSESFKVYAERNILLTHELLRAGLQVGTPKFVNSSSSSVYGQAGTSPTRETDVMKPISPYGVTKLAAENLVSLFGTEFGLNTVSLRYFTVYGPRQRPDMAFNKLISAARSHEVFKIHGDGTQKRDFTFVSDVVQANKLVGVQKIAPGTVFNVGGGNPVSLREVIGIIEKLMDSKIDVKDSPLGPGNPLITSADFSLIKKVVGWFPQIEINEGLSRQIEWHGQQKCQP